MNCRVCGNTIDLNFFNKKRLEKLQLCFTCDFWWEKIYWRANEDTHEGNRVARIHNNHYTIHPDGSTSFEGFGGRLFVIRFDNGDEVTTHNLWHQGEIPKHFRPHLPNNAVFVDQRRICKCRTKFYPMTDTQTMCLPCVFSKKPQRW